MFPANSPQAKGRIERLWETLQSRLVTEFRINNIKTIEQANNFLIEYIKNIILNLQLKQVIKTLYF